MASELSDLTSAPLTAAQVELSVQVLDNIVSARPALQPPVTLAVLESVDHLLAADRAELREAERAADASSR